MNNKLNSCGPAKFTINAPFLINLILNGAPLVVLDYPNHRNVGDSAIYLGEINYLRKFHPNSKIIWVSSCSLHKWPKLPDFPSEAILLLHGGGNFGNLWPHHQKHRQRIVQHYQNHRIIQLPQSIYFDSPGASDQEDAVFSRHPDFHLFVRDCESLEIAASLGIQNRYLAPDMALFMDRINAKVASRDCIALLRNDHERNQSYYLSGTALPSGNTHCLNVDWHSRSNKYLVRGFRWTGQYPGRMQRLRPWIAQRLASQRVHGGIELLSQGRIVITDRLHGHILCTLMNKPHVILDNSYSKISNFRSVWNTGENLCHVAVDYNSAIEKATILAQSIVNQHHVSS